MTMIARYVDVRRMTESLAGPLSAEDQTVQSMPDVSPTKWHRAHVTWFFEAFILAHHERDFRVHNPVYWNLFNSYYEAMGPRYPRPDRGFVSRPGIDEVAAYRADVDERMARMLGEIDDPGAVQSLLELGLNHEQQHQELLLMDIAHVLSRNPMRPVAYGERGGGAAGVEQSWLEIEGGVHEVGADGSTFAFDNEMPRHRILLQPFRIARRLVTNGEWLEFLTDGGYERPELWLSDGWARVRQEGWRSPLYWIDDDGGWLEHTLNGTRPLREDEPVVHVSHYEADAYACWAGARLPTEFEWEIAAAAHASAPARDDSSIGSYHPLPARESGDAMLQAFDTCWQWTSSAYLPYPGFRVADGAVGEYNGKFMSNQMVLRGGACVTPLGHARHTYRNFFPPHSRWMFSGVRLATDVVEGARD
jgi:ergothioneine biosynthesis protein EgtB